MRIKAVLVRIAVPLAGAAVLATTFGPASAGAKPGVSDIGLGSSGPGVVCVQGTINRAIGTRLVVDGIDGPQTTAAVEQFQHHFGLLVDGIVGPVTGNEMLTLDQQYQFDCFNYLPS